MFLDRYINKFIKITALSLILSLAVSHIPILALGDDSNKKHLIESDMTNAGILILPDKGISITSGQTLGKYVPITGNVDQLKNFFKALKNSRNQKVRIAHFGDSMILGDIITEYLRANLQNKYGGGGIGFLPVVSDDYRMRRASNESFSNDWSYGSIVSGNRDKMPLGINGAVSYPQANSWVQYETTTAFPSTSYFDIAKMYYCDADENSTFTYSVDMENSKTVSLKDGGNVQQLEISTKGNVKKIKLKFNSGKAPHVFGVSLESRDNGVIVDNFPLRGNSGVSLLDINENILRQFNNYFAYDLIILQYGANVYFPTRDGYVVYEKKMEEVIARFRKLFPNAGIILISVGDKTIKKGNQFLTNPDVTMLLETQKKIVAKTGIAFWNMWEAMGGFNSMNQWVNAAPPFALRDYAHFTNEGGARIAEILTQALEEASRK
jgi:hypothetical protein